VIELCRTVRLCLNDADPLDAPRRNTFSAWPPVRSLGRYYELHVSCVGQPDAATGYLVNIKHIDRAVHGHVLPLLRRALAEEGDDVAMGRLMVRMIDALRAVLPHRVAALRFNLTPMVYLEIADMPDAVTLAQQYEFSAAHRLHTPELSDEENRRVFGKCNNPAGHGHNYRVEVAVRCPIDAQGQLPAVEALDALVHDAVIDKLDHKHLNLDVPAFAALNPSVEHIAQVIHGWLAPRLAELVSTPGVTLEHVRVWETGKTACTYRGA
jgi:6-pyruvoyltetrahydropterin/6-carboxytetrahydropterin synthase